MLEDLWSIAGIQPVGGRSPGEIAHRLVQRGEAARAPRLTPAEAGVIGDFLALGGPPRAALDRPRALLDERRRSKLDAELDAWADAARRPGRRRRAGGPVAVPAPASAASFSYYDGFLFEVRSPVLGDDAPVAGRRALRRPARANWAARSTGAVGCAVRPARAWVGAERTGMSAEPLTFGLFSKGRLKEQAEDWLADCGLTLEAEGGERGYVAAIRELPGDPRAAALGRPTSPQGLDTGELHLGVSGEDLLRERGEAVDAHVLLLRALGFGRADLVVAAPASWIDVETMADLEEVGRRLRGAHRPPHAGGDQIHGADARLLRRATAWSTIGSWSSSGATEGAPAAGAGGADRRHHHHRRDVAGQRAEAAGGRPDPEEPGAALRQPGRRLDAGAARRRRAGCLASSRRARGPGDGAGLLAGRAGKRRREAATEPFLARGATRRAQGLLAGPRTCST